MRGKNKVIIKTLLASYVLTFILAIGLIAAMHTVPPPALAVFRIPTDLREVGPHLGLSWPTSLKIYQIFLLLFFTVVLLNGLGLYKINNLKWRSICKITSFLGLLLMWSVFLFFMLPLILDSNFDPINLKTSFIYSLLAFAFFIVNLLTFAIVQKEGKETLRL